MTTTTLTRTSPHPSRAFAWGRLSAGILAVWFVLALAFAWQGGVAVSSDSVPTGLLLAVTIPIGLFLAVYNTLPRFRAFILALDIRTVVAIQQTRVVGAVFLGLLAVESLPGLFAWPAGAGDVAVGLAAIWVTHRLVKNPDYLTSGGFLRFNLLGIFDFVVAFATGVLASDPTITGGVTSAPVNDLPFAMIPGFLVPLYAILHLIAIIHWRQARRG